MRMVLRRFLLTAVAICIKAGTMLGATEIFPSIGDSAINELLNVAGPGDTLLFHPGIYRGPFILTNVHGSENQPLVIKGFSKEGVVIDGQASPGMFMKNYAFLLNDCSWLNIENFTIRNCWTDLIRADDVSYLSIRNCNLLGGKRALFATGRKSHHFLVEFCSWEQDERVWTHEGDYSWDEVHHGIHRHHNGSLFQGSGISGVFVLRDNHIQNTFNAFRLSQISDGKMDLLACTNGEIYRNTIINTSDNVLEPELHAKNLHYYHNRMINGHAFVSITEVTGGEIYIYGNTAISLPSSDGWTIFKISSREVALTLPLYIYNNSWQVDFDILGSPGHTWKNNHLRHFNNAAVSEVSDSFGIYHTGLDNQFDYDCSNVPFPSLLTSEGFEKHGIVADPRFRDPCNSDFRLKANSPCIDRGKIAPDLIMGYEGDRPDMGAYDGGELIKGPPFRYMLPDPEVPFREMPRITRCAVEGESVRLWFSVPLKSRSVHATRFMASVEADSFDLQVNGLSEDGYCLRLSAGHELTADPEPGPGRLHLLFSRWPEGTNGKSTTSWASSIPVKLYK